jgi:predicted SAM-dependent methyltransferase
MSKIKLHLGCGKRYLHGYVHVDLADHSYIDYKHDIFTLPMFGNSQADLIYVSHALEYVDRVELPGVLSEWRRVLKPGGTLRLAVPDFTALLKVYQKTNSLDDILGPLYGRWTVSDSQVIYHKTVYDGVSLSDALTDAGFVSIRSWDWRMVFIGENQDYDDYSQAYYPHMDKDNGLLISLNLEADKEEENV